MCSLFYITYTLRVMKQDWVLFSNRWNDLYTDLCVLHLYRVVPEKRHILWFCKFTSYLLKSSYFCGMVYRRLLRMVFFVLGSHVIVQRNYKGCTTLNHKVIYFVLSQCSIVYRWISKVPNQNPEWRDISYLN